MRRAKGVVARGPVDVPRVAGLVRCRAAGPSDGPPWRAREVAGGADVLVRPMLPDGSAAAFAEVPEHPHLLAVRAVADESGRPLLVCRWPTHGSLATLLERRGGLSPGEVTGLGFAVARALATLHAQGLVHGRVDATAVLLGPRGRPLLDGAALAVRSAVTPADDVRALGELLARSAGEPLPLSVRAALSAARDPDPALRPGAADLARELVAEVHPEPLRLVTDAVPGLRPGRPRGARSVLRRLSPRRGRAGQVPEGRGGRPRSHAGTRVRTAGRSVVPVVVATGALVGAVLVGRAWAAVADPPAAVRPAARVAPVTATSTDARPSRLPVDWRRVVEQLDAARAVAFTAADVRALEGVDATRSSAWASDAVAVRALVARGLRADRYVTTVVAVHEVSRTSSRAVVDVDDVLGPCRLVDRAGRAVAVEPGHAVRRWRLDLVTSAWGTGWLVVRVRAS
jgi:eukaryotic-like serine/threonine-protein kinase